MKVDKVRGIVIAALLCLAGVSACAQPTPVIRTETRVVLVDAIVTNKQGEYVRDLTAKDFRIWEDNKEQTIQSVSLEQGSANTRPRYLVLFFAGMSATDQLQSRQAISGFIDASAQENRKMAVVSYGGELRIDQNFTDDAGRLKEGVSRAISSGLAAGTADSNVTQHTAGAGDPGHQSARPSGPQDHRSAERRAATIILPKVGIVGSDGGL